jgi:hypothetical protein
VVHGRHHRGHLLDGTQEVLGHHPADVLDGYARHVVASRHLATGV